MNDKIFYGDMKNKHQHIKNFDSTSNDGEGSFSKHNKHHMSCNKDVAKSAMLHSTHVNTTKYHEPSYDIIKSNKKQPYVDDTTRKTDCMFKERLFSTKLFDGSNLKRFDHSLVRNNTN